MKPFITMNEDAKAKPRPIHAVIARLTMEEHEQLSAIARRQERPVTFLVRKAVLSLIEREKGP